ncbi:MAG: pyridoxal phosphate-dependent aminotransferase [Campylobacterota bacterium]
MLSKRVQVLSESLTIKISSLARDLKAQGKDVLSFSAGEPDFDTPQKIKDTAKKAIDEGFTKYTAVAGIPELLDAIAGKLKRENNLEYERDEIIVNNGAKHTLFNIFQALLDEGDEVIIPAPYWVTYPELVKYSQGVPVVINTDDSSGFKITAQQLKDAITPKTKILILTTPSNPTGAVYSKEELQALGEVLQDTAIKIVSDEMYEKLVFDVDFTAVASINHDMLQRTITVNGLSKSVAMTGWRFGYMACKNKKLIKAINSLQSQSTSNINSITQKAAVTALDGSVDDEIEMMRKTFAQRCDVAVEMFNAIEGLSVVKPHGAFYLFVNCKAIEPDSMKFCQKMLEEVGVATVPGLGFGADGYFRFSYALDLDTIKAGIKRIEKFVQSYK